MPQHCLVSHERSSLSAAVLSVDVWADSVCVCVGIVCVWGGECMCVRIVCVWADSVCVCVCVCVSPLSLVEHSVAQSVLVRSVRVVYV